MDTRQNRRTSIAYSVIGALSSRAPPGSSHSSRHPALRKPSSIWEARYSGLTRSSAGLSNTVDGTVEMWAEDAQYLIPAGWTKLAEWTTDEDAGAERSEPQPVQTVPQPGSME
jgi:hypothetical protein